MAPSTIDTYRYPIRSDSGGNVIRYGTVVDLNNGNYSVQLCPVIAGTYEIHVLFGGKGISNQPVQILSPYYSSRSVSGEGSYLGSYVGSSPFKMVVTHSVPSVITSTVFGPGLLNATVGVSSYFLLTVRDAYDNVVRQYPYMPNVTFRIDQSPGAFVYVWDYKNGSFLLQYTPLQSGNNFLSVFVNGFRIRYSPFIVPVADGGTSGKYSYAEGGGLKTGVTGKPSYFTLFSFDGSGNRKSGYNDLYKFVVGAPENIVGYMKPCPYPPDLQHPICDPLQSEGGYYYGEFIPLFTGPVSIHIYLVMNNTYAKEVSNSPFESVIAPSAPKAENTIIDGTLHFVTAGLPGIINLQLRDYFGNRLISGHHELELAILCVACDWGTVEPFNDTQALKNHYNYKGFFFGYPNFYGEVTDKQDGSFDIHYTVNRTGEYVLRLALAESGLNVTYFNDTSFGSLFNDDFDSIAYIDSLRGAPDSRGTTISWTGDIGGPIDSRGGIGEGSYVHRYFSRAEPIVSINASKGIGAYNTEKAYLDANYNVSRQRYNGREHYWSARFVGMVTPEHAELYKFVVETDDDSTVRLWIGGLGIGINNSYLGDLIIDTTRGAQKNVGYYQFSDTRHREILLEFVHHTGDAILSLSWESLSTPFSIIPASAFTHWRNMSHYNLTVHPAKLCSRCSTSYGQALVDAQVAKEHSFLVYGRDQFGNLLQHGGDMPSMVAVGTNGVSFRGKVTDYGNSTYRITYYPTQSGTFRMYVTIGCCVGNTAVGLPTELRNRLPLLIGGAPFILQIRPAILNVSRSIAVGQGIIGGTVNSTLQYTVLFRDIFNNPTTIENTSLLSYQISFKEKVTGDIEFPHFLRVRPTPSNLTVEYSFLKAGTYWMTVQVGYANGSRVFVTQDHVASSPFAIVLSSSEPETNRGIARGLGLRQANASIPATYEIQLYDHFGNKIAVGGNKFYLRLVGDSNFTQAQRVFNVVPRCRDTQNGRYICDYTALHPGPHELVMRLLKGNSNHPGGNGLRAFYFNSRDGANIASRQSPILTRIESTVELYAANGYIIPPESLIAGFPTMSLSPVLNLVEMGQSIRWTGFLIAPRTDNFRLTMVVRNLNATIYFDNALVFDSWTQISYEVSLIQHSAYALRIEVATNVLHEIEVSGSLLWSTPSVRQHPVSTFFLYTDAEDFPLSPYPVVVS